MIKAFQRSSVLTFNNLITLYHVFKFITSIMFTFDAFRYIF
ncbi:hypothetical protein PQD69_gp090 [Carnobacterium phage cd4]|uniref:Uncharacterized protein n=1 Tax=Carnobacterium phage cd4 TaxID=2849246 RepID=A0AAE7VHZ3_9CAUD|nr:hypothetical protein PQD69_gp090 [Carnobacterium phage cd4]QXP45420.1 hypothetical protein cd4_090 [Carnobacterium phage cd4]